MNLCFFFYYEPFLVKFRFELLVNLGLYWADNKIVWHILVQYTNFKLTSSSCFHFMYFVQIGNKNYYEFSASTIQNGRYMSFFRKLFQISIREIFTRSTICEVESKFLSVSCPCWISSSSYMPRAKHPTGTMLYKHRLKIIIFILKREDFALGS
jgi:hypothetical protein